MACSIEYGAGIVKGIMNIQFVLKQIRKINWQYLVSRREALLFSSTTDSPYCHQKFKKVSKLNWKAHFVMRFSDGNVFHSGEALAVLSNIFAKGGIRVLLDFRRRLIFYVTYFNRIARQIEKMNCRVLSQKRLLNLTKKYFKNAIEVHNFLLPMPVADKVLSKMIFEALPSAPEEKRQEWLAILTYPTRENEHTKEERSFYKLAEVYQKKDKNLNRFIDQHLKKFAWIGTRGYWWRLAWKREDIEGRLKNFFTARKNPKNEIQYLDSIRKERRTVANKLLKELKIKKDSSLYKLILLAKEFVYLRAWRTDLLYGAGYRAKNFFFEIARRAGVDKNDLCYLAFYEVIKLAQNKKIPISNRELENRKKYFVAVTIRNTYQVFSGKVNYNKLRAVVGTKISRRQDARGNTAYPGKTKGRVRLVLTGDDIGKIKRGEILVAVMTFPHFIPAMEKAAAFVTDEGGILCHAAIISREMKKPCIIGTRVATQVLRDSDLVEVDADKGVVRVLKRKKD